VQIEKFKEHLEKMSASPFTVISRLSDVKIFFKDHHKLNTEIVQKFINEQISNGHDSKTVARRVSSLRHYARFTGIQLGDLNLPRVRRRIEKIKLMSEQDAKKMTEYINKIKKEDGFELNRLKVIILLLGMGLRRNEVINLKLENLDFESENIKFVGKGDKGAFVSMYGRAQDFKDYIELRAEKNPSDDYVIIREYKNIYKKIEFREFYNIVYEFTEYCLGKRINPHSWRHFMGVLLLNGGTDLRTIQEILRHSDIGTTQIYLHVSTEKVKDEVRRNHPLFQ